jgi:hypothetical protein
MNAVLGNKEMETFSGHEIGVLFEVVAKDQELAKILRSKNLGPFEITLDVLFDNEVNYLRVKNSGVITVKK